MSETIEVAKTGRARCRACRQAIEKGALRFGEEQPSAFTDGVQWVWYHLACGAKKKPAQVKAALASFAGEVPERAEIEKLLAGAPAAPAAFPYAERAPTGRSKCLHCEEAIAKGALRVAVEREVEAGGMTRTGAGYLHPGCAREFVGEDGLAEQVRANSNLAEADLQALAEDLGG